MDTIKICVVGTNQSGSTRLYNLVRMIYEKKRKTVCSSANMNREDIKRRTGKYNVILCKIHDTDLDYLNHYDIKLLPIRNILDCAISASIRNNNKSTEFLINHCFNNINMFDKIKPKADFIFRYENYDVNYIKKLCAILNVSLNNNEIIDIMIQLEKMLTSKNIIKKRKDNNRDPEYNKTLFSQEHNTSNGKINKFISLPKIQLNDILKEEKIYSFLIENLYF